MPQNDFNLGIIKEFRENGGETFGPFKGRNLLLLTTKGAKSGNEGTTPLVYSKDGDRYVIIASMGGAPKSPAWYHNIVANPTVTLEVGKDTFKAKAAVAEEPERTRLYNAQAEMMPAFTEYQQKTTRVIPVVVLTRA